MRNVLRRYIYIYVYIYYNQLFISYEVKRKAMFIYKNLLTTDYHILRCIQSIKNLFSYMNYNLSMSYRNYKR